MIRHSAFVKTKTAPGKVPEAASSFTNAESRTPNAAPTFGLTGIFLAKLDGTAKGGIVIAIKDATNIPVKFIGVGETPDDVQPFDPDAFVEAMFAERN